jgi:hypothetical protein
MAAPRKYPPELKDRALRLWRSEQPRRPIAHIAGSWASTPRRCGPGSARMRPTAASVTTGPLPPSRRSCDALALLGGHGRPLAAIDRGLTDPAAQGFTVDAELVGDPAIAPRGSPVRSRISNTMRVARSRSSGGYLWGLGML